jgi:cob(I)alamin adenosyltransferase
MSAVHEGRCASRRTLPEIDGLHHRECGRVRGVPSAAMRIYTRKGDQGTTGLLFGGDRVSKADLRTDAYGTTDEAVSALGLARAAIGTTTDRVEARLAELTLRLQRELFVVGAELATHVDRRGKLTAGVSLVTPEMVTALEHEIDALEADHEMPAEFVIPGETMSGAAFDLARTTVRRAERRAVALSAEGGLPDSQVVPYLNRLADLLFVVARAADGGFLPLRTRE